MIRLNCIEDNCKFQTQEVEQELAIQLLTLHMNTQHVHTAGNEDNKQSAQAERVKRPILTFTGTILEQEEYDHFLCQFELYKDRLGGAQEGALLLRESLATNILGTIFSSYGNTMKDLTETQLRQAILTCCVSKQTIQARINELYKVKQDSGQTVQNF